MNHVPMTLPDLALSIQTRPFSHTTTYVQLDDGRILHVSFHVREYSEDGGLTWSAAELMNDTNGDPVGNSETSLVRLSGRCEVGLAARVFDKPGDTPHTTVPNCMAFWFWRSEDAGKTWHPPIRMTAPGMSTAGLQDTFLRTRSGRIVLPVFHMFGQDAGPDNCVLPTQGRLVHNQWMSTGGHFFDPIFTCNYVVYSDDGGRSWQMNKDGELIPLLDWNAKFSYCNESSVTEVAPETSPGRLLLMMRTGMGRLYQAWSNDNGETWTRPQPTVLAATNAPAQLRTLPNGHLLCVWNQESEAEIRQGYTRTRISAAISRDGGRVWEFFQNVESLHETTRVEAGPIRPVRPEENYFPAGLNAPERDARFISHNGPGGKWCYPSVCVLDDRVLIAHTYTPYIEHPTDAQLIYDTADEFVDKPTGKSLCQKLKVLPLKWFYGGKEPANNPFLETAYEPAKP